MTPAERDAATIRRQQDRIGELEEVVRQLREAVTPDGVMLPASWGLTRTEQRGLLAMHSAAGGFLSNQKLFLAFSLFSNENLASSSDVVKVRICRLRKKIVPVGIEIVTRWGRGYELTSASRDIIKAALEQRAAA